MTRCAMKSRPKRPKATILMASVELRYTGSVAKLLSSLSRRGPQKPSGSHGPEQGLLSRDKIVVVAHKFADFAPLAEDFTERLVESEAPVDVNSALSGLVDCRHYIRPNDGHIDTVS